MKPISALFFDLGGVLLSNGWDRDSRRRSVVEELELDWDEFADRPLNLECAADEGISVPAFTGTDQLERDVTEVGVQW